MIYENLVEISNIYPNKIALKDSTTELTYEDFLREVHLFASFLRYEHDIDNQSNIIIYLPNSIGFAVSFFAINYCGAISVLIDTKTNSEIVDIITENNVRIIISDTDGELRINDIFFKNQIQFDNIKIINMDIKLSYAINEYAKHDFTTMERNKSDNAMILYTSGSTGKPKGILNNNKNLIESFKNYTNTLKIKSDDSFIAVTPFFHSYCFGSCFLAGLLNGCTLFIFSSFRPKQILLMITRKKATFFHGVPFMYDILVEFMQKDISDYNFKSIRYFISAGGILNQEIQNRFYRITGMLIHQEYGSSETGTISINLNTNIEKSTSVGKPLENVFINLVNIEGFNCLEITSKAIAARYVNGTKFTNKYTLEDICSIDDEGNLYIIGRKNRVINISGLKVSPDEVEYVLHQHCKVSNVLVRGIKNSTYGEIIEALVIRKDDLLTVDELIKHCSKSLAFYKIPKLFKWVESFETSSLNKIKML